MKYSRTTGLLETRSFALSSGDCLKHSSIVFIDLQQCEAFKSGKSWFSISFTYMQSWKSAEFIPNKSKKATFYRNYTNLFYLNSMFAKVQHWKVCDHWLANTGTWLQIRHMENAESVGKIPIFTWCIFGVPQLTSLHSIDCITSLDIKSRNQTMSRTSQSHSKWDFPKKKWRLGRTRLA